MSVEHAESGKAIDLHSFGGDRTSAIVKRKGEFEAIRLVLPAGKSLADHKVKGALTVQCLSGFCKFSVGGQSQELRAGAWLYLDAGTIHAVEAIEASTLLLTVILPNAKE